MQMVSGFLLQSRIPIDIDGLGGTLLLFCDFVITLIEIWRAIDDIFTKWMKYRSPYARIQGALADSIETWQCEGLFLIGLPNSSRWFDYSYELLLPSKDKRVGFTIIIIQIFKDV